MHSLGNGFMDRVRLLLVVSFVNRRAAIHEFYDDMAVCSAYKSQPESTEQVHEAETH